MIEMKKEILQMMNNDVRKFNKDLKWTFSKRKNIINFNDGWGEYIEYNLSSKKISMRMDYHQIFRLETMVAILTYFKEMSIENQNEKQRLC